MLLGEAANYLEHHGTWCRRVHWKHCRKRVYSRGGGQGWADNITNSLLACELYQRQRELNGSLSELLLLQQCRLWRKTSGKGSIEAEINTAFSFLIKEWSRFERGSSRREKTTEAVRTFSKSFCKITKRVTVVPFCCNYPSPVLALRAGFLFPEQRKREENRGTVEGECGARGSLLANS